LEKEVIFKEDLELIFGKRPWDERQTEPTPVRSKNGSVDGNGSLDGEKVTHSPRPVPVDDTPEPTLPQQPE